MAGAICLPLGAVKDHGWPAVVISKIDAAADVLRAESRRQHRALAADGNRHRALARR